jgi:hypothetical protein
MKNKYTSLDLSRKLAKGGCELVSEEEDECFYCMDNSGWDEGNYSIFPKLMSVREYNRLCKKGRYFIKQYKAYDIMNDICVRYCKEFFGDKIQSEESILKDGTWIQCEYDLAEKHSHRILELMQQGKKEEAEKYIWENCVFNKNGEEK